MVKATFVRHVRAVTRRALFDLAEPLVVDGVTIRHYITSHVNGHGMAWATDSLGRDLGVTLGTTDGGVSLTEALAKHGIEHDPYH